MSVKPAKPIEIFYSYSHKDEDLRDELEKHLAILKRQGVITGWHDRRIGAGTEWAGEIDTHLNTAHIILLLISADFLASDYCYDVEMKQAMKRQEAGEARAIPVILRPVDWKGAPFGKLQALPKDAKPVTEWPNRDAAFLDVARGIRAAVEELVGPSASLHPVSEEPPPDTEMATPEEGPEQVPSILRLLPGRGKGESAFRGMEQFSLMKNPPFHIPGRYRRPVIGAPAVPDPHIVCGLYLENEESKPGRYIHVVVRIFATPSPIGCEFVHRSFGVGHPIIPGEKDPDTGCLTVQVQFAEKLVVYQYPVLVGDLTVRWDVNLPNDRLPESVVLDYDIYSLDGASHGEIKLLVE